MEQTLEQPNQKNRQKMIISIIASILFHVVLFVFIFHVRTPKPEFIEPPLLILQSVEAPAAPVPAQQPAAPTRAAAPSSQKTVETPAPSAAKIEPSSDTRTPADIQTSSVGNGNVSGSTASSATGSTSGKGTGTAATSGSSGTGTATKIGSAQELDNTSYEPLFNPKPVYPTIPRTQGIAGYVDVDLTIDEKGKVLDFKIVKSYGHPTFGEETAKVIMRWRFPPPRIKGKPVRVIYQYRVQFRLND